MHEPQLALAALPANPRIYGVELRDYSLGHELWLTRENSPFLSGATVMPQDVFEAVWICSSTWQELKDARRSFLYLPKLWLLKRNAKKCNRDLKYHPVAVQAFKDYRESGCLELPLSDNVRPERERSRGRECGTPFILRLHQFLCLTYRLSDVEAWDHPVGLAKMRWAAFWEQEGGLDVKNAFDAECDRLAEEANKEEETCPA